MKKLIVLAALFFTPLLQAPPEGEELLLEGGDRTDSLEPVEHGRIEPVTSAQHSMITDLPSSTVTRPRTNPFLPKSTVIAETIVPDQSVQNSSQIKGTLRTIADRQSEEISSSSALVDIDVEKTIKGQVARQKQLFDQLLIDAGLPVDGKGISEALQKSYQAILKEVEAVTTSYVSADPTSTQALSTDFQQRLTLLHKRLRAVVGGMLKEQQLSVLNTALKNTGLTLQAIPSSTYAHLLENMNNAVRTYVESDAVSEEQMVINTLVVKTALATQIESVTQQVFANYATKQVAQVVEQVLNQTAQLGKTLMLSKSTLQTIAHDLSNLAYDSNDSSASYPAYKLYKDALKIFKNASAALYDQGGSISEKISALEKAKQQVLQQGQALVHEVAVHEQPGFFVQRSINTVISKAQKSLGQNNQLVKNFNENLNPQPADIQTLETALTSNRQALLLLDQAIARAYPNQKNAVEYVQHELEKQEKMQSKIQELEGSKTIFLHGGEDGEGFETSNNSKDVQSQIDTLQQELATLKKSISQKIVKYVQLREQLQDFIENAQEALTLHTQQIDDLVTKIDAFGLFKASILPRDKMLLTQMLSTMQAIGQKEATLAGWYKTGSVTKVGLQTMQQELSALQQMIVRISIFTGKNASAYKNVLEALKAKLHALTAQLTPLETFESLTSKMNGYPSLQTMSISDAQKIVTQAKQFAGTLIDTDPLQKNMLALLQDNIAQLTKKIQQATTAQTLEGTTVLLPEMLQRVRTVINPKITAQEVVAVSDMIKKDIADLQQKTGRTGITGINKGDLDIPVLIDHLIAHEEQSLESGDKDALIFGIDADDITKLVLYYVISTGHQAPISKEQFDNVLKLYNATNSIPVRKYPRTVRIMMALAILSNPATNPKNPVYRAYSKQLAGSNEPTLKQLVDRVLQSKN